MPLLSHSCSLHERHIEDHSNTIHTAQLKCTSRNQGARLKLCLLLLAHASKQDSPLKWSLELLNTLILILMKFVCEVCNTTADKRWACYSQRRKMDEADVRIYNPYTFKQWWLQDQDQQITLKAMTIFCKLHSILNEITVKPVIYISQISSVLKIAFHTL